MLFVNSLGQMVRGPVAKGPGAPGRTEPRRRRWLRRSLFVVLAALTSACVTLVPSTRAVDDEGDDEDSHQTYTVLVAAEDAEMGASIAAFFPGTLRIHVGDVADRVDPDPVDRDEGVDRFFEDFAPDMLADRPSGM